MPEAPIKEPQPAAIAVDVGGTFTDIVAFDRDRRRLWNAKVPSTPADQSQGFEAGVAAALAAGGIAVGAVGRVFHGTTVATNLILEGKGAAAALLTTAGFRHVLEIGRHDIPRKSNLYSWVRAPRPVPPERIFEIGGRHGPLGEEIDPLDEATVAGAARRIRALGIRAVAICFIHAYANPAHERRARDILLAEHPEALVSLSAEVLPVFREYERSLVTILNSAVMPAVSTYVGRLEERMAARGIAAPLLLMKSSGGVTGAGAIRRAPVLTALSGPAAGAIGAAFVGAAAGFRNLITIDIGGTSADICLIKDGAPGTTTGARIGEWPVPLPMIDIHTIGAGGGSIAAISPSSGLSVGPRSAGAEPGPVAYGRSGTEPTVTDAHLVLGHLPGHLLDGGLRLDRDAAAKAIAEKVAKPLGLGLEAAARGILAVIDNNMVGAIRVVSIERGHDPRDFVLVPFGGAGPLHGGALARLLGIKTILVPPAPGVLSALGLLVSNLKSDYARTCLQRPPRYDHAAMQSVFEAMEAEALAWFEHERLAPAARRIERQASMRYAGQGFELTVPWPGGAVDAAATATALAAFHALHRQLYTFAQEDTPVEIVTLRVTAIGELATPDLPSLDANPDTRPARAGTQRIAFADGARDCPVFDRRKLGAGAVLAGPAIVTQLDATTLILAGQRATVDRFGSLVIEDGAER
jgi:N-methylhydantoinase A